MRNLVPHFIIEKFKEKVLNGSFKGSVMFIDISGFTAMTHSLMKNGKEGAEILTQVINNVFTPSINAIYEYGGFISTFAGDAFTAIFPNEKADIQNVIFSAKRINETFKEIGSQKTKFGDFELSVKIGLSIGSVNWGIIKSEKQNTYYFQGQAIDDAAESEHHCDKGEIIIDEKIKKILPINIQYFEKEQHYFKLRLIHTERMKFHKEIKKISKSDISSFVPEIIVNLTLKGEFRNIISCFISFQEKANLFENISETITLTNKYGGYFNKVDFGDKGGVALVIFGAPVALEKMDERACDFALALKKLPNFPLRIGLTSGTVFTGFVGSDRRNEYTALGMVVNLSARYMMKADWNDIYLNRYISSNIKQKYEFEYLSDQDFKGFPDKIPVYNLLKKKELVQKKLFEGKLIGRAKELKKLKECLNPLLHNKFAGVVYIDGNAGIGKSRLIAEMKESLEEDKYHWFYMPCDEILQKSFNPLIHFLKYYFEQSEENSHKSNKSNFEKVHNLIIKTTTNLEIKNELIRTKSIIGALLEIYWKNSIFEQLDAKGRFENTLYSIKNLVKAISLQKPLIIELDDGHFIDSDSKKLLNILTRNVEDFPFLILTACRFKDDGSLFEFGLHDVRESRIELQFLEKEYSRNLIISKFNSIFKEKLNVQKLPDKTFDLIWEKSEGNPFYIEQIIAYLTENDLIDYDLKLLQVHLEIPSKINSIIIARIDKLTEEVKQVIKTASVLGREFLVNVLSEMLTSLSVDFKADKLDMIIEEGGKKDIWNSIQEIHYIFKHAMIRESVYEIQLKQRLRELHKLAAETIEKIYEDDLKGHYSDLAFHFEKAEINEKTIEYLDKAGNFAKYNFQNEHALDFYDRKIRILDTLSGLEKTGISKLKITDKNLPVIKDYIDTLFEKKYFQQMTGNLNEAEKSIELANELANKINDKDRIGKAKLDLGNILKTKGKLKEAFCLLQDALSLFEETGNKTMAGLTNLDLGIISFFNGQQKEAFAYFDKELEIFKQIKDGRKIADALGNIGVVHRYVGNLPKAMTFLQGQLSLSKKLDDKLQIARASGNIGWVYEGLENYEKAMEFYEKALTINMELGQKSEICRILDNIGIVHQCRKDYKSALENHRKALNIATEIDSKDSIVNITANMGHAYKASKDFEKASEYYENGIKMIEEFGIKTSLPEFLIEKADLLYLQKKYEKAKKLNEKGLTIAEETQNIEYVNKGKELKKKLELKNK